MKVSPEKITACLNRVRDVREHITKHAPTPDGPVLSVDNLHWAVEELTGLKIEMLEVTFVASHLRGKVERYADRARVFVKAGQSDESKRFVATKELSHLLLDGTDDWSTLGVDTIRSLLTEWRLCENGGMGHEEPTDPLLSEAMAQFAAILLLYPMEYRQADFEKLDQKETTLQQIAIQHEIPAFAVEQAMEQHELVHKMWTAMEDARKAA